MNGKENISGGSLGRHIENLRRGDDEVAGVTALCAYCESHMQKLEQGKILTRGDLEKLSDLILQAREDLELKKKKVLESLMSLGNRKRIKLAYGKR